MKMMKPDTHTQNDIWNELGKDHDGIVVFLGGSIEQGAAEQWQDLLAEQVEDQDVVLLNPRRDHWDSSWEQSKDNPNFREQVEWELFAQEQASLIVYYFDPNTKSPVTLLELGLFTDIEQIEGPNNIIVCCPEGFWRKGNVDIVCERYGLVQLDTLEDVAKIIRDPSLLDPVPLTLL